MNQFDDFFKVQMALAKYDGVFFPKSRARTMDDVGRKQVDGCATFFKTSKFVFLFLLVFEPSDERKNSFLTYH